MAEKARRRKRLVTGRRPAIVVLAGVAIAIGISRQQAEKARDEAFAEAQRAEASKLLALARVELDRTPPQRSPTPARAWSCRHARGPAFRAGGPLARSRGAHPGPGEVG